MANPSFIRALKEKIDEGTNWLKGFGTYNLPDCEPDNRVAKGNNNINTTTVDGDTDTSR